MEVGDFELVVFVDQQVAHGHAVVEGFVVEFDGEGAGLFDEDGAGEGFFGFLGDVELEGFDGSHLGGEVVLAVVFPGAFVGGVFEDGTLAVGDEEGGEGVEVGGFHACEVGVGDGEPGGSFGGFGIGSRRIRAVVMVWAGRQVGHGEHGCG